MYDEDLLVPSPTCCDFFRECDHNVEWERPCPEDEDGVRLWFDEDLQVMGARGDVNPLSGMTVQGDTSAW